MTGSIVYYCHPDMAAFVRYLEGASKLLSRLRITSKTNVREALEEDCSPNITKKTLWNYDLGKHRKRRRDIPQLSNKAELDFERRGTEVSKEERKIG